MRMSRYAEPTYMDLLNTIVDLFLLDYEKEIMLKLELLNQKQTQRLWDRMDEQWWKDHLQQEEEEE